MGTGSGAKLLVYNTRERLVSTDHNREQAFGAQALAEALRWILDPRQEQDLAGAGVETMGTGGEAFLRGTVIAGLRFRPDVGTTHSFVEPGAALLVDNNAPGSDDSVSSFVSDAGAQTIGQLELTPGAGSTRIDVVECQRVTSVAETDSRDVFNPATGLFSPVSLTKVQGGVLAYRIRTGTPGSGFPGTAAGWMPLAVCSVPAAAGTWNDVVVWDVRPLAADRTAGPFATSRTVPWNKRSLAYCDALSVANHPHIYAEVDLDFGGYRAGGVIKTDSSTGWIDPTTAALQAPGFAFGTVGAPWYCYLVFPFGLPRWVRYTDSSAGMRVPGFQRGIPVISSNPCAFNGAPLAPGVATPTATGLLDSAGTSAIVAFAGRAPYAGGRPPVGMHSDGNLWTFVNPDLSGGIAPVQPTSTTTNVLTWAINSVGNAFLVPGNARALVLRVYAPFVFPVLAAGAVIDHEVFGDFTISDGAGNTSSISPTWGAEYVVEKFANPTGGNITPAISRYFTLRIPLQPWTWTAQTAVAYWVLTWIHATGVAATGATISLIGWELGP